MPKHESNVVDWRGVIVGRAVWEDGRVRAYREGETDPFIDRESDPAVSQAPILQAFGCGATFD